MWDNFLGAQTRGGWQIRGCICPSRLGRRIKKTAANETRRKAARRRSEREGRWGGGNICEATTLWKGSAACPPVCKAASCTTHTQMCTWVARHTQECQHINMQTRVHEDRFIKWNKGVIDLVLECWEVFKYFRRRLHLADFNYVGLNWNEFEFLFI